MIYKIAIGDTLECIFTSDLHGDRKKYERLFEFIQKERPDGVFIGGDILPSALKKNTDVENFLKNFLKQQLEIVDESLEDRVRIFMIMGNDDPRAYEKILKDIEKEDLLEYMHNSTKKFGDLYVSGYSFIPPSPFRLKDWERYDVSRHVGVGSISPENGTRTVEISEYEKQYKTIEDDLKSLSKKSPPEKTIYLFHAPPYETSLDRADLDGKKVDHAPVDVHVGSIAIKRFIEEKKPYITLHGHVHETVDITGNWKEKIERSFSFSGVHNSSELALVKFDTDEPGEATRTLIDVEEK